MKNLRRAVALAVLLLSGLTALGLLPQGGSPGLAAERQTSLLGYVPADTIFYFGYSEPYAAREYYQALPAGLFSMSAQEIRGLDPAELRSRAGPAAALLLSLYQLQLEAAEGDGDPFNRLGLDAGGIGGAYAVGALPVVRVALDDTGAFWAGIDDAEDRAGVEAQTAGEDTTLRRYAVGGEDYELVIATRDGYAIATLEGPGIDSAAVQTALGERRPQRTLGASERLDELATRHDLLPWATGFIDHEAIVAGLTGAEGNRFGQMLDAALAAAGVEHSPFDALRTPECRADFRRLAATWPRTVAGLSELDPKSGYTAVGMAIETSDESITAELSRLRGHIPESVGRAGVAGLGIGLNVGELVPVLQALTLRFTEASFECPPLVESQQALLKQNIAALGMMTAMVGDVHGLGLALESATPTPDAAQPVTGSGIMEIVTPRPQILWQIMQPMLGVGPAEPLQPGADPIPIEVPMLSGTDVSAALDDSRLVFLLGEGTRMPEGAGGTEANGLLRLHYNYARMGELTRALQGSEVDGELTKEQEAGLAALQSMEEIDLEYRMAFDVVPGALRLDTELVPTDDQAE